MQWSRVLGLVPAVAAYGLAFGVLAREGGMSPWEVGAMSAMVHAGGAQFVFVGTLAVAQPGLALLGATLVNLRFGLYGALVRPVLLSLRWPLRLAGVHFVGDEQVALTMTADRRDRLPTFMAAGVVLMTTWVGSTYLGAVVGGNLQDPAAYGLDAAFPAVFVVLLVSLLKEALTARAAVISAVATAVTIPFVPAGLPVIVAVLAVAAMLGISLRPTTGDPIE